MEQKPSEINPLILQMTQCLILNRYVHGTDGDYDKIIDKRSPCTAEAIV